MTAKRLSAKDPGETIPIKFYWDDVVSAIDTTEALSISLYTGSNDTNMADMLFGDPVVDGTLVVQLVQGGVAGNTYKIRNTIHAGQGTYVATAILPVETE